MKRGLFDLLGIPRRNQKLETDDVESRGTLLVYGAGANQVPVLEACRRGAWTTIAIDQNPEAPGAAVADRFICASLRDHERIRAETEGQMLRGVIARITDDEALDSSRRLASERGLAAPCPALVSAATSKRALAEVCRAAGLNTPRRYADDDTIDAGRGALIVRPDVTLRGKAGIYRVDSPDRLEALRERAASHSSNGRVDVAQWIPGSDVSILAVIEAGVARRLAIWDEWVAVRPDGGIFGLGVGMPSVHQASTRRLDEALAAFARAFPESRAVVTLSLRVDASGAPWVIEVHLGLGGDGIADQLLPAAHPGFDPFAAFVALQSGTKVRVPRGEPRPRALLRAADGWQLIAARNAAALRRRARVALPHGCEVPQALWAQSLWENR